MPGLTEVILTLTFVAPVDGGESRTVCEEAETTRELVVCLENELVMARQDLKALDRVIVGATTPEERALFENARKEWSEYLEANCESASQLYAGGSLEGVILLECRRRMTRERIEEIRRILRARLDGA